MTLSIRLKLILTGALSLPYRPGALLTLTALSITRPVNATTQAMSRLAAGDRRVSLPEVRRADEIGRMNDAVRRFKA